MKGNRETRRERERMSLEWAANTHTFTQKLRVKIGLLAYCGYVSIQNLNSL